MPAYVESLFYQREGGVPWHSLGTQVDKALTGQEALELSGADYSVETGPLFTRINDGFRPVPGVSIYRKDTGEILGKSGRVYQPYQNTDMIDWFEPLIDSGLAKYETGGVLHGGQCCWFLCKLNSDNSEIVKDDEIQKYLLLSNWHDGLKSIRCGFTPIRVVCANTEAFATEGREAHMIRVRHTSQTKIVLDEVRESINLANQQFEMTAEKYRWLANRVCNKKALEKFAKIIVVGDENKPDDEISTRSKNIMDEIVTLATRGQGNDLPGVRGTWWAAYNGVSEWLNYKRGHNEDSRLNSIWFGTNYLTNQKALSTALTLAG